MTTPLINVPLAERVLGHITAFPDEHEQNTWRCESGMCFAGWAAQLAGYKWVCRADSRFAALVEDPDGMTISEYMDTLFRADLVAPNLKVIKYNLMPGMTMETRVRAVSEVARDLLFTAKGMKLDTDLRQGQANVLFDGHNTIEDLQEAVKHLANGQVIMRRLNPDSDGGYILAL